MAQDGRQQQMFTALSVCGLQDIELPTRTARGTGTRLRKSEPCFSTVSTKY
jgi:hypothetical protein